MKDYEEQLIDALPKDKNVRAEYDRLMELFASAPESKLALLRKQVARAAFLGVMLDRLEADIVKNGWEEEYTNGATQRGKKKRAAADLHTAYTKSYAMVMKQLTDTLEAGCQDEETDEFDTF